MLHVAGSEYICNNVLEDKAGKWLKPSSRRSQILSEAQAFSKEVYLSAILWLSNSSCLKYYTKDDSQPTWRCMLSKHARVLISKAGPGCQMHHKGASIQLSTTPC